MVSLFSALRSALTTSIGNRRESNPQDVKNTRRNFARLGRYEGDTELGVIDRKLDNSIRAFQRDKGLKEDGLMHPGGETERALNRDISRMDFINARTPSVSLTLSDSVGNNRVNRNEDVRQLQRSLGALGFASEAKLFEPSGILDRETVDGVREFQSQSDLRVDGFLNPGGETETALKAALKRLGEDGEGEGEGKGEGEGEDEGEEYGPPAPEEYGPPAPPPEDEEDGEPYGPPAPEDEEDPEEDKEKLDCNQLRIEWENAEGVIESIKADLENLKKDLSEKREAMNQAADYAVEAAKEAAISVVIDIIPLGKIIKVIEREIKERLTGKPGNAEQAVAEFWDAFSDWHEAYGEAQQAVEAIQQAMDLLEQAEGEAKAKKEEYDNCISNQDDE